MYCTDSLLMLKKTEFPLSLINSYALTFKKHYHGIGWQEYARHHGNISLHNENESIQVIMNIRKVRNIFY